MKVSGLKRHWFLIALLGVLVVGFFAPSAGVLISFGKVTATVLVIAMFLISGYRLPTEAIRRSLKDWRLHLVNQGFIFVVTPLYAFLTVPLLGDSLPRPLKIGIFALAVMPTTISSCIMFTQMAGGNTAGAMFNAVLANVVGVGLSPLLLALLMRTTAVSIPADELLKTLYGIGYQILLPLAGGQVLRHFLPLRSRRLNSRLGNAGSILLLLIVFITISKSALSPVFRETLPRSLPVMAYLTVSYAVLQVLAGVIARPLKLSREDRIAVLFVAPQKTLAMGVPLLAAFFSADPDLLGLVLVPLLFYHPVQLFGAGIVKEYLERQTRGSGTSSGEPPDRETPPQREAFPDRRDR